MYLAEDAHESADLNADTPAREVPGNFRFRVSHLLLWSTALATLLALSSWTWQPKETWEFQDGVMLYLCSALLSFASLPITMTLVRLYRRWQGIPIPNSMDFWLGAEMSLMAIFLLLHLNYDQLSRMQSDFYRFSWKDCIPFIYAMCSITLGVVLPC